MQICQSLAEARQPDFDSDGDHSNAYWAKKSSRAIANNRFDTYVVIVRDPRINCCDDCIYTQVVSDDFFWRLGMISASQIRYFSVFDLYSM
jgi:hypothetical protein